MAINRLSYARQCLSIVMILLETTGPSSSFSSQGGIARARPREAHRRPSTSMRSSFATTAGAVVSGKWGSASPCVVRAQLKIRGWGTPTHLHEFHQQQQHLRRRNLCSVRSTARQSESPSNPGRRASDNSSTSSQTVRSPPGSVAAASTTNQQLPPVPRHAHRVVLMRHGESEFNNANIFTGWCDVALTPRGVVEAVEAGEVFRSLNVSFRKCYASLLTRSIITAHRCLEAAGVAYTPLVYDWRLNERHYGSLQGLGKDRTADRLGRDIVMEWRRSYHARPPPMTEEHPHYWILQNDDRYRNLKGAIPLTESLQDCQIRVIAGWNDLVRDIQQASDDEPDHSLVVAHANTLRALVMHLDDIPPEEIEDVNIGTALPFYYDIDKATGKRVVSAKEREMQGPRVFRGVYIDDERKRRNFLERRRAANDPWLWALHDDQVSRSMLLGNGSAVTNQTETVAGVDGEHEPVILEGLEGLEEEAMHNTEVFAASLLKSAPPTAIAHPESSKEK